MVAGIDPGADASVVTIPMILLGCGMGALASQLGAVTVSAVPDERSAEVGGVQNTATNLGASLGTALIGSILIAQPDGVIHHRHSKQSSGSARGVRAGVHPTGQRRSLRV